MRIFGGIVGVVPEIVGITESNGQFLLPNRNVEGILTTRTGHTLHDNPFGVIDVVGTGNEFLIKFQKGDYEEFQWLTLLDLNVNFWANHTPASQIIVQQLHQPQPIFLPVVMR